jgi:hypothetical protein
MARPWMSIAIGILVIARISAAQPAPALDQPRGQPLDQPLDQPLGQLEKALPPGWSLLATDSELVIRHDRPCYVTGIRHENAPAVETKTATAPGGGPLVTIQLRYRLEPRWNEHQLAAARVTNDRVASELRALAARYRIDAIHRSKGRPLPANPDERARQGAYEAAHAQLAAQLVKLPRCSLGDASVFDGDDTYAQLSLEVDPPEVMTQAHHIVALMRQHCG